MTTSAWGADTSPCWCDRGRRRIEDRLAEILWRFQELSVKKRQKDAEAAEAERLHRERERRELELSIRRDEHGKLVKELERQAGAWLRAKLLRWYLGSLRDVTGVERVQGTLGQEKIDFLLWAERYVDQLDPLHPLRRVPEMMPPEGYSYGRDLELEEQLARFLGRDWHKCFKVSEHTPQASTAGELD